MDYSAENTKTLKCIAKERGLIGYSKMRKKDLVDFLKKNSESTDPAEPPGKPVETTWCASFDIGKKNFAFYIEEFDSSELSKVPFLHKLKRYNSDGTPTKEFRGTLGQVYNNGRTILLKNHDLTYGCDKNSYLDPETFHNMADVLEEYVKFWDKCDHFIIEQQMSFGRKKNTMALKLGQHCYSYFVYTYGRSKCIVEFPAYHKTQILGAQKDTMKNKKGKTVYRPIDKCARKKWTVEKTKEIMNYRNDDQTLNKLTSKRKKDDLADVICQLQAYKFLTFVERA